MNVKRWLSILLAIVMVVSIFPAPAYAAEETQAGGDVTAPAEEADPEESAAEDTGYPTLTVGERVTAEIICGEDTYFAFIPEISAMYIMETESDQLGLNICDGEGTALDSWIYSNNGRGYFLQAGETYYIRVSNYSGSEITSEFWLQDAPILTAGQKLTLTGSKTMIWIEVEESGFYEFVVPYNVSSNCHEGDGMSADCVVSHNDIRVFYLKAGCRYSMILGNDSGADSITVSLDTSGDLELELDVTKELTLPSQGLQVFRAQVEESGYYVVHHTLEQSMNLGVYDIQNRSNHYLHAYHVSDMDGNSGYAHSLYMEAGKTYGLYI